MPDSRLHRTVAGVLRRSGALGALGTLARSHHLQPGSVRLRRNLRPRLLILCYHRIGTGGIPYYSQLSSAEFDKQMAYLRRHCRVISLDQLVSETIETCCLEPAVAVTFDDGYLGTYTEALPILRKYSIPATVYLAAGCIESREVGWYDRLFVTVRRLPQGAFTYSPLMREFHLSSPESRMQAGLAILKHLRSIPDSDRQRICTDLESAVSLPPSELANRLMSWDQAREMQLHGISFEAHTLTHPVLSRLDENGLERELKGSKRLIEERLGRPVCHFAYPFGKPDDCGMAAPVMLQRLGFRSSTTTVPGVNTSGTDRYQLRRVQIGEDTSLSSFALRLTQLLLQEDSETATRVRESTGDARTGSRETFYA